MIQNEKQKQFSIQNTIEIVIVCNYKPSRNDKKKLKKKIQS